jgi:hypothetical protein
MAKPRLSEGRIPFQIGIGADAPPPDNLPFQGDAYIYDAASGTGSVIGGTILDGPDQDSPTGSIAGGTVLDGEYRYDT